jgi:hypothetical protein
MHPVMQKKQIVSMLIIWLAAAIFCISGIALAQVTDFPPAAPSEQNQIELLKAYREQKAKEAAEAEEKQRTQNSPSPQSTPDSPPPARTGIPVEQYLQSPPQNATPKSPWGSSDALPDPKSGVEPTWDGRAWVCPRGFALSGRACAKVQVPANAELDYKGTGWVCSRGYRQVAFGCERVAMPANAELDYKGTGWVCRNGYRRYGDACQ